MKKMNLTNEARAMLESAFASAPHYVKDFINETCMIDDNDPLEVLDALVSLSTMSAAKRGMSVFMIIDAVCLGMSPGAREKSQQIIVSMIPDQIEELKRTETFMAASLITLLHEAQCEQDEEKATNC